MGIAEIEKKIFGEAEDEARKIRKNAEAQVFEIEAESKLKAEKLRREILAGAEKKAEEERKAMLVPARLAAKKKLLEEKHNIMEEVFAGVSPETRERKEIEVAGFLYG